MTEEPESLTSFETYLPIPVEKATTPILSSRWVHKLKHFATVRSRMVVRGFEQVWTDLLTASPTPALTTMLMLLTLHAPWD